MKQGSNRRPRPRGHSNNKRPNSGGRNSYDSTGPAGKVRGTAQQVLEKYQALGRDATSAGDRIAAESYFQFAEHYYRIVNADGAAANANANTNNTAQNSDRNRQEQQDQPDIQEVPIVEVNPEPVEDLSLSDPKAQPDVSDDQPTAAIEPVPIFSEQAPDAEEKAPKAPRRRRARAKVDAPKPDAAE